MENTSGNADGLSVTWRPAHPGEAPDAHAVTLGYDVPGPKLSDQVEATIKDPLAKKAMQQAARAAASGARAAIILDQAGHGGIAQGGHWLVQSSQTIETAVTAVLGSLDHHLSAVLFHDAHGTFTLVFGNFPGIG